MVFCLHLLNSISESVGFEWGLALNHIELGSKLVIYLFSQGIALSIITLSIRCGMA